MDAIKTEGLTKYYGKARGIEDVSLTVRQGDFFGFIGPNGAGKSTLIRTLLGLLRPSAGRAEIFGLDIGKDRERILARVGYLPSEAAFWPGMRVQDALRLSAGLRRRDCRRTAAQLCEQLRLDPSQKIDTLSLGGRKKTAIVCALQHEPELLILDEPTSGLDPLIQREFFTVLRERHEQGAAVFLSSHILSEIQRSCTHAAIIREGSLIAGGSVAELVHAGAKRVRVQGRVELHALDGVRDLHPSADGADFLFSGDTAALLSALAAGDVRELTVSEPDLEEVFLHYYQEGSGYDHRPA